MKKFVSLLIAIVLVISMVATVGAASFYDVGAMYNTNRVQETAIQALSDAGIVFGYNGYYRPNDTITRAEVCAIITRCLYGENGITYAQFPYNVNTNAFNYYNGFGYTTYNTNTYSDVSVGDWGYSYIMTATRQGLVNGYPDGTFKPDRQISYDEMCAIILRAIGYKTTGTWPTAVNAQASQLGITSNLTGIGSAAATRGDVAVMIYNARNCRMLSWNTWQNRYYETNRIFGDVIGLDMTNYSPVYTITDYIPNKTYNYFTMNDGTHYMVTFHVTEFVPAGTLVSVHMNKYGTIDGIYNVGGITNSFVIDKIASDNYISNVSYVGNSIRFSVDGREYVTEIKDVALSEPVKSAVKTWVATHNENIETCNDFDIVVEKALLVNDKVDIETFDGVYCKVTITELSQKLSEDDSSRNYLDARFENWQITYVTPEQN